MKEEDINVKYCLYCKCSQYLTVNNETRLYCNTFKCIIGFYGNPCENYT